MWTVARDNGNLLTRIAVALPFAMDPVNVFVVDRLMIDTGILTAASWRSLERGLIGAGLAWTDIDTVVITHMHPDHVGLVEKVVQASGARVAMHESDADLLREFAKPGTAEHWNGVALALAGSPPEMLGPVNAAFQLLTVKFPSIEPDIVVRGGERLGALEVLWTPGHSPGHVCLYDRERKWLFSGDHILETTSPNIGWLPDGDPLGDYLASLREIVKMDIDLVLPGHGEPIRDCRAWIASAIAHHERRLERIREILMQQPRTAHEISAILWPRELDPIHYRFAIFEVLAHMVHMERKGWVGRDGMVWRIENRIFDV